jgi:hypothetical protein
LLTGPSLATMYAACTFNGFAQSVSGFIYGHCIHSGSFLSCCLAVLSCPVLEGPLRHSAEPHGFAESYLCGVPSIDLELCCRLSPPWISRQFDPNSVCHLIASPITLLRCVIRVSLPYMPSHLGALLQCS